jgi:two-component system phosphate regulon response regulator PhoB
MMETREQQYRVLVIEDEDEIRDLIALHLKREGLVVEAVASAEDGLGRLAAGRFDLLALDWMLPGVSGIEVARTLRRDKSRDLAILMITARADTEDIIAGLEAGADDYLTKPFDPNILMARVRALLRRNRRPQEAGGASAPTDPTIRVGNLTLNSETYEVKCDDQAIAVTPSEFKLLLALVQSRGRVLTRDSLISQVQGEGVSVVGRTVDTHIFGLRKKLGACADVIETVRGIGYRVKADF